MLGSHSQRTQWSQPGATQKSLLHPQVWGDVTRCRNTIFGWNIFLNCVFICIYSLTSIAWFGSTGFQIWLQNYTFYYLLWLIHAKNINPPVRCATHLHALIQMLSECHPSIHRWCLNVGNVVTTYMCCSPAASILNFPVFSVASKVNTVKNGRDYFFLCVFVS